MATTPGEKLLRRRQVEIITGLSRSTIYQQVLKGRFPKPIPLVGRTVAWTQSSIDQWISDRIDSAEKNIARKED